ncbi:hypothetical protein Sliba_10500 [Streptomyces nigrescens]|uniref:Uncharacterized protein n=1 Tax=Streptomyces nigrescens TaxID=1920 RepID=A0A640TA28_STRNI|nr:hypothetical protein Sliba_10500 [Streptomyces libani subsp. libani]GGV87566.1 hypothetical protein GCM10010500_07950 [Streptomyces libani subsp. libani]
MLALLDLRHQEWVLRICRERAAGGDAVVVVLTTWDWTGRSLCGPHGGAPRRTDRRTGPPVEVFTAELLSRVYRQPVEVIAHPPLVPASGCVFPN